MVSLTSHTLAPGAARAGSSRSPCHALRACVRIEGCLPDPTQTRHITAPPSPLTLPARPAAPPVAVPLAIGGKGLPADVKLRDDLPSAGLGNVAATSEAREWEGCLLLLLEHGLRVCVCVCVWIVQGSQPDRAPVAAACRR